MRVSLAGIKPSPEPDFGLNPQTTTGGSDPNDPDWVEWKRREAERKRREAEQPVKRTWSKQNFA